MDGELLREGVPVEVEAHVPECGRDEVAAGDFTLAWDGGVAFERPGGGEPVGDEIFGE